MLNQAFVWQGDWDFGGNGDSALVMMHAYARKLKSCGAAACPGNQVVKIEKGAKLEVVKPDGTILVYQLLREPNRKAPSVLPADQIVKLRSDIGPSTLAVTACNPRTWYDTPRGKYKHRVLDIFDLIKIKKPNMST